MTYKERTKAVCASILLIIKNATVIIPVIEGIIYTIIDSISALKKVKKDDQKIIKDAETHDWSDNS